MERCDRSASPLSTRAVLSERFVPLFHRESRYSSINDIMRDTSCLIHQQKKTHLPVIQIPSIRQILVFFVLCSWSLGHCWDPSASTPISMKTTFYVSESEDIGATVFTIPDAYNWKFNYQYSLKSSSEYFLLTSDGTVRLKKRLDYERDSRPNFKVIVKDGHLTVYFVDVTAEVWDVNEFIPEFTCDFRDVFIRDAAVPGRLIKNLKALDGDKDDNKKLIYSVTNNDRGLFKLDQKTGEITLARELTTEDGTEFEVDVVVSDGQHISPTARFNVILQLEPPAYDARVATSDSDSTVIDTSDPVLPTSFKEQLLEYTKTFEFKVIIGSMLVVLVVMVTCFIGVILVVTRPPTHTQLPLHQPMNVQSRTNSQSIMQSRYIYGDRGNLNNN